MNEDQLQSQDLTAIRRSLPINSWPPFADAIVAARRNTQGHLAKSEPDRTWFGRIDELRENGLVKLPTILTPDRIADIRSYFDANPVHKGAHSYSFDGRPRRLDEVRRNFSLAGYRFDQVVRAPHLVDAFNDPRLIDFIESYLGCVPTLYSLNAWWSFPANKPELIHVQHFHRDIDDWRFLTLFLYVTTVDGNGGPHQVIRGSHTLEGMKALKAQAEARGKNSAAVDAANSFVVTAGEEFSTNCEELFGDSIVNATGPAGTMWLVNTIALHRGLVPVTSPRLLVWARFGLGACVNSADIEQGPIARRLIPTSLPDTPRNRYVNRLLFDYDRGPAHF